MLDLLARRRSIRRFTDETVTDAELHELICAALTAPTSRNRQATRFLTVRDRQKIQALISCRAESSTLALQSATLVIIVMADETVSDVWVEDASIAAFALQIEAEHLGLGSNWIQIHAREKDGVSSEDIVRQLFHVPENFRTLCLMALGRKKEEKPPHDLDALDFERVTSETF